MMIVTTLSSRMQRKRFDDMVCPIARSLEHVGEWWSILILRDAFAGKTRFDEFQNSLGIAPNMLTRRLGALVEAGMLVRSRYNERPPRDEYLLTERGRDFRTVLLALLAFGDRHFAAKGRRVRVVDAATGVPADPVLVDRASGRVIAEPDFRLIGGPWATAPRHQFLADDGPSPPRPKAPARASRAAIRP